MARFAARWAFVPAVVVAILAGVVVGRMIEAFAVACVLFVIGTYIRRLVAA